MGHRNDEMETRAVPAAWVEHRTTTPGEDEDGHPAGDDPGATPGSAVPLEVTVLTNARGLLTKEFRLGADGKLVKGTKAILSEGTAHTMPIADLHEFASLLHSFEPSQCLAYGVTGRPSVEIVTKSKLHEHAGKIARDRKHFQFRKAPGIFMLDHDPAPGAESLDREVLRAALIKACPALAEAPMLWTASASSHIVRADTGEDLTGLRGQRIYIPVADASDIPRAGTALYHRLWLAGFGRFIVSRASALLDRNIIDKAVWQPEHEDFAAGAYCHPPLEQRRPKPFIWGDAKGRFDSRQIGDLTDAEHRQAGRLREQARQAVAGERAAVREQYLEEQAGTLARERRIEREKARGIVTEALDRQHLFADFVLYPEQGDPVTVGEVLDAKERWHGQRFADPLEPDYRHDRRIAWANLRGGGTPYLHSHAHGSRRFQLLRQPIKFRVEGGDLPRLADECLSIMRTEGDIYDFGQRQLVRVANDRIYPIDPVWLGDYLGRHALFEKYDRRAREWLPIDTPERLAKTICARTGERELPVLRGIVTAPTLREDGTVLDVPGYDAQSGLLFLSDQLEPLRVPCAPDEMMVKTALETVWQPFSAFPFVDAASRGVLLAALLTAAIRRSLPTSPAFGFDAPQAGSGKTLLAHCVSALGGNDASSFTPPNDDDETRKLLFAALRDGSGCVLFDNVVHPVGGAALNQFITESRFAGRVLGQSENEALPNTALLLLTGNNLRVVADMCRRVLVCRIDAQTERPFLRSFPFCPLDWTRSHCVQMVVAALTLIRAYIAAGSPRVAQGSMASFERWDDLVRQTVCWLATLNGIGLELADPALTIENNVLYDPHKDMLHAMLTAWQRCFGRTGMTAGEVIHAVAHHLMHQHNHEPWAGLKDVLDDLAAEGRGPLTAKRLGRWLAVHKEQIVGGLRFVSWLTQGRMYWAVQEG